MIKFASNTDMKLVEKQLHEVSAPGLQPHNFKKRKIEEEKERIGERKFWKIK